MTIGTHLKQSALWGLGISLLVTLVLSLWVCSAQEKEMQMQQRQRLAILQANAVTLSIADSNPEDTRKRVSDIQRSNPLINSVIIVEGSQLLASTKLEDAAPRQLRREEKALFDLSNQIRTARETNRGEEVVRNKTIQIEDKSNGHQVVTLPYLTGGEFAGIVQVELSVDAGIPVNASVGMAFPLILLLGALVVGALLRMDAARKFEPSKLLGLGAFVLFAWLYQHQNLAQLEQGMLQENQLVAQRYLATAEQYDHMGYLPWVRDSASINLWDTDHYQRPRGLLATDGSISAERQLAQISSLGSFIKPILWVIDLFGGMLLLLFIYGYAARAYAAIKQHSDAYLYVAPAMIGMLVLVFFPFAYGITLAFTDTTLFNESLPFQERLIGLDNFKAILGDFNLYESTADGVSWNYQNFYWTLFVTIVWTVSNVFLGVTIGFLLAMALNTDGLRGKAIYRVLLILPWAIPNYITALVWRGMFHPQFGVINQVLQMFGLESVNWFDGVFSSFITGLATNAWLSFPFMMVVILGALQSIPKDMYEAAEVEGANRWQRLRYITLPLLKPTLIPAIVLSVVWTFNMFNIIFLVSGGEPAGANEILVTKAYKLAFENYQYAYAAAYSTVIFMILLVYGVFQTRASKATESY
jgi:arabinogalactan oligomer/maltooligosaccharide transport system permease protein